MSLVSLGDKAKSHGAVLGGLRRRSGVWGRISQKPGISVGQSPHSSSRRHRHLRAVLLSPQTHASNPHAWTDPNVDYYLATMNFQMLTSRRSSSSSSSSSTSSRTSTVDAALLHTTLPIAPREDNYSLPEDIRQARLLAQLKCFNKDTRSNTKNN